MKNLRLREIKSLVQGHPAGKWQRQELDLLELSRERDTRSSCQTLLLGLGVSASSPQA